MLELNQIVKEYVTGDSSVTALNGVSIRFRENEFVSILGPSGCGKTTLLNIIGGLDKYTSGDLVINGVSTKQYRDCDWDSYRNHSIGFVFQSYNLIPHQTVLANVELALTLSGVSKKERRRRAAEALEMVGLGDQLRKKPNQMSGGQMQRVAIARALVNNPDILLADEPTGALDTATSEQVMEILANVAKDRLVIMVTHNPDIAERYSTRIVKLLDGNIISDSMPVTDEGAAAENGAAGEPAASEQSGADSGNRRKKSRKQKDAVKRPPRTSMNFFTALALSLNNLLTKKARTILTAFAGSIGIIGIALILSLSNGVQLYIDSVEEDTLSSYPIRIEKQTIDITSFASAMQNRREGEDRVEDGHIYTYNVMTGFMELMLKEVASNDLSAFKKYIEANTDRFGELTSDIQYSYSTPINIYRGNLDEGVFQVNPGQVFSNLGMKGGMSSMYMSTDVWQRLIDNDRLLDEQYEVLCGRMPEKYNEVALIVSNDFEVTDYTLYSLGVLDPDELTENFTRLAMGEEAELAKEHSYTYDELLGLTFRLLINTDYFERQGDVWVDKSEDEVFLLNRLENSPEIKITCILRSDSDAAQSSMAGIIGYRTGLMDFLIDSVNKSDIVTSQKNSPDIDIFTGIPFERDDSEDKLTMEQLEMYIASLPADEQEMCRQSIESMRGYGMDDERILEAFAASMERETTDATYEGNLRRMGVSDPESPSAINIFPKDFESKDRIADLINEYNDEVGDEGRITYTDYVGLIMSSVTTIINAISYILIAFVAISLVVSSIMIGIITYISVLERTKEIGILRAIGASKTDISRVFNAETLIVGFTAGAMGIIISFLLLIPINAIIEHITDIAGIAVLPAQGAVILVLISMFLTFIAGLIPSGFAARKDPVVALRTE